MSLRSAKESANLVSKKMLIGAFHRYQMKCKSVSKKSPRYRVSPLGDERGDIRNAQIVKAVFGAQGMNVALKDAMLCWGEDEDKPEVDPFAALEDALSFAAQS